MRFDPFLPFEEFSIVSGNILFESIAFDELDLGEVPLRYRDGAKLIREIEADPSNWMELGFER